MPSEIEETFCIEVDDRWCAVLGNHYPNFPGNLAKVSDSEEVAFEKLASPRTWCTQRLCDQHNVQYKHVVVRAPTCPDCLRIKGLEVEFATQYEVEDDTEDAAVSAT